MGFTLLFQIGDSFAHCLGGLMSTVAQGIQLNVITKPGVFIEGVYSTKSFTNSEGNR